MMNNSEGEALTNGWCWGLKQQQQDVNIVCVYLCLCVNVCISDSERMELKDKSEES